MINSAGIAIANTTKGAGTFLIRGFLIYGHPIIITKLIAPIKVALGSQLAMNSGIDANNSNGSFPLARIGFTSKNTGICFPMMINPMAANIPCTAESGKKSINLPSLKTPKRI